MAILCSKRPEPSTTNSCEDSGSSATSLLSKSSCVAEIFRQSHVDPGRVSVVMPVSRADAESTGSVRGVDSLV
jgi:hypothetical protein